MAKDLYYDSESLGDLSEALRDAGASFSGIANKFRDNSNPSFGWVFNWLVADGYNSAKQSTVNYVDNVSAIFSALASKVDEAKSMMDQLEQTNIDKINKLSSRVEDVNDRFSTHHTGSGDGGGGGVTNVTAAGGSVSIGDVTAQGGSSSSTTGDVNGNVQIPPYDDEPMPGDIGYQDNTDVKTDIDADINTGAGTNASTGDDTLLDIDSDGDNQADYGIQMKDGVDLNAQVSTDGGQTQLGLTANRRDQWGNVSNGDKVGDFNIDTDGDGKADASMHVDKGQKSQLSFGEDTDGRYVSVDFDHDGDADFTYRVDDDETDGGAGAGSDNGADSDGENGGDSADSAGNAEGHESEYGQSETDDQAVDNAWQEIAKNDPLGRSAEELRRQFEDRDVISWGDDDDNGDLVFKPSIQPRLYTTQPVTPKGSESWIR